MAVTPVPRVVVNAYDGDLPDDVNQLLGAHSSTTVYDSSSVVLSPGAVAFSAQNPLFDGTHVNSYAQAVTLSGQIDRVVLPLSIASGVGADVLVSLISSGGFVLPVATTLVPKEALVVPADPTLSQGGPASQSGQMLAPWTNGPGIPSSYSIGNLVASGDYIVSIGGQSSAAPINNVYTNRNSNFVAWQQSTPLPVALTAVSAVAIGTAYIVVAGGSTTNAGASVSTVYIASIDSTGTIGAWSVQTALPVALHNGLLLYSNGFLYYIGGQNNATPVNTIYAATLQAGNVGSWTQVATISQTGIGGTNFIGMSGGVVNGSLLFGNGLSAAPVGWNEWWIATPQLNVVPLNPIPLPKYPISVGGAASVVIGDTLYVIGGQVSAGNWVPTVYSMTVSPTGDVGPWSPQPDLQRSDYFTSAASVGSTLYVSGGVLSSGQPVQIAVANRVPTISVPLQANVGAGSYFVTVSLANPGDVLNATQLAATTNTPGANYGLFGAMIDNSTGFNTQLETEILPSTMSGNTISAGWDAPGSANYNCQVTYSAGNMIITAHGGGYLEAATINPDQSHIPTTGPFVIPVVPGVLYTLTFNIKASTAGRHFQPFIIFADATGVVNSDNIQEQFGPIVLDNTSTQTSISMSVRVPPLQVFASIYIGTQDNCAAGEVHTVSNVQLLSITGRGFVPCSIYQSGTTSRALHLQDDIVSADPRKYGTITYDSSGKPIKYVESTLGNINLLQPSQATFGSLNQFQGSASGWPTKVNCTTFVTSLYIPSETFPAYNFQQITNALAMVSVAAGAMSVTTVAGASGVPVTPNVSYTAFASMMADVVGHERSVKCGINFYNISGTQIGSTTYGSIVTEGTITAGFVPIKPVTKPFVTMTAPAGAAFASIVMYVAATAAASEKHYVNCASLAVTTNFPTMFFLPNSGPGTQAASYALNYAPDGSLASIA